MPPPAAGGCQMAEDHLSRDLQLQRLRRDTFDVAVIGGGINGAAVARDAAMRGLRVALIERGDFAGQTSSHSSKLIHGGLRYLPQGQLRLVYEALGERERLSRLTAPHLVKPIPFLFPVYHGRTVSRPVLWTGLFIYDLLARTPRERRFKALGPAQVSQLEPDLSTDRMRGGAIYYDGHGDDARLTIENAIDAAIHGAAAANYVALEAFDKPAAAARGLQVRDVNGGGVFEIRARIVVNAAGPWIDHVRQLDQSGAPPMVRLTKGVHLVFDPRRLPVRNSIVLSDGHGRIIFIIRDRGSVMVGTTDTDYAADPASVRAAAADVDYLLDVVTEALPGPGLKPQDVIASFAGLRVLVGSPVKSPSRVPREETIVRSASGMWSIAGGKLTTHRRIAERVVDMICRELGRPSGPSPTLTTPLPGARPLAHDSARVSGLETKPPVLWSRYGSRAALVEDLIRRDPQLAEALCPGCPLLAAEAVYAARYEMARTLEDFMVRRTAMTRQWPAQAHAAACAAARLMGAELGWSPERQTAEAEQVRSAIRAAREF